MNKLRKRSPRQERKTSLRVIVETDAANGWWQRVRDDCEFPPLLRTLSRTIDAGPERARWSERNVVIAVVCFGIAIPPVAD